MDKEKREQELMNSMNISIHQQPLNVYRFYPYNGQNLQTYNNYQKIGYINNIQAMNGYHNQIDYNEGNLHLNPQNKPENVSTPKNKSTNSKSIESPKEKLYINYLFTTITKLLNEGKITMKYLTQKTGYKKNERKGNRRNSDCSFSSSKDTLKSSSKSNNMNQRNICEFPYEKNNSPNSNRKTGNNQNLNLLCENPLCNCVFNSNKEKNAIKIKGLKTQEKKLCKKCWDAVKEGNYCYYCNAIYRDLMSDAAKWVKCDFCHNWEHFECELAKGKRFNSTQELNDVKQYMCPICTNKRAKQNNKQIQKKLINKKRKRDIFEDTKSRKIRVKI